jgi:hypothetical protein
MNATATLRMSEDDYTKIYNHLFPGDHDEHGLVLLAGISSENGRHTLQVREVHLASEGRDYVKGKVGYKALSPGFIHRMITRARDQGLVYLAVHNHGSDRSVGFSNIDFQSHELGYPALLQISKGRPVGALVFGHRSIEADIWFKDHSRVSLDRAIIVGKSIRELRPHPIKKDGSSFEEKFDRQVRFFGITGQEQLSKCKVAIVGLGGVGSLISELLARLGVGEFILIDDDKIDKTNLSRIVGASMDDVIQKCFKTTIAERVIKQANPDARIQAINDDVSKFSVAKKITSCDYIFLAADSMRARLVVNAIVHQYLIPAVQVGSKIRAADNGDLLDILSVVRPIRPGRGCLWCNQLIDPTQLAKEAKSDEERKAQAYGVDEPNPSVITLNAVGAGQAVNDFLMDFLCLRQTNGILYNYRNHIKDKSLIVNPLNREDCEECSVTGERYGLGDGIALPCREG